MKRDDALWKGILEDIFDDFLRFFFPNAEELFDFSRPFEFLDKELEQLFPNTQDEFNPKYIDKLVKVYTPQNEESWILVHVEVQGSTDADFGQRMFTYFYRILDKYQKPITAFAIFTDSNKKFKPKSFGIDYLGTSLHYGFNTYKVLEQDEKVLRKSDNPFAVVALTVKTALQKRKLSPSELFELKIALARDLFAKGFAKEKVRKVLKFLKLYIRFEETEFITKFDQEIDEITNKSRRKMGIEEFVLDRERRVGRAEGEKRGLKIGEKVGEKKAYQEKDLAFVKSLLAKTDFSDEQIADIANVSLNFIRQVKKQNK